MKEYDIMHIGNRVTAAQRFNVMYGASKAIYIKYIMFPVS